MIILTQLETANAALRIENPSDRSGDAQCVFGLHHLKVEVIPSHGEGGSTQTTTNLWCVGRRLSQGAPRKRTEKPTCLKELPDKMPSCSRQPTSARRVEVNGAADNQSWDPTAAAHRQEHTKWVARRPTDFGIAMTSKRATVRMYGRSSSGGGPKANNCELQGRRMSWASSAPKTSD